MSSTAKTILEEFKKRQEKIEAEATALDKELNKKRIEKEKIEAGTLMELAKKRTILDKMKADYHMLKGELEAKSRADIEATVGIGEKVKAGTATISDYFTSGLSENAIAAKAREENVKKLSDAVKLIRNLWTEIIRLEHTEAECRSSIHRYMIAPAQNQIKKLESEIELLRVGVNVGLESLNPAWADFEKAKQNVGLCEGKFALSGMQWVNLSYEELCDVRLDPRLPDAYLEDLERIIAEVNSDQRIDLFLSSGLQTGSGRNELTYRQTVAEGAFLETSKAATHKAKEKGGEEK